MSKEIIKIYSMVGKVMINLFDCCLIAKAKNEAIVQEKPLKSDFAYKNLFDCCLITVRIQGLGLRIEERVDA